MTVFQGVNLSTESCGGARRDRPLAAVLFFVIIQFPESLSCCHQAFVFRVGYRAASEIHVYRRDVVACQLKHIKPPELTFLFAGHNQFVRLRWNGQ